MATRWRQRVKSVIAPRLIKCPLYGLMRQRLSLTQRRRAETKAGRKRRKDKGGKLAGSAQTVRLRAHSKWLSKKGRQIQPGQCSRRMKRSAESWVLMTRKVRRGLSWLMVSNGKSGVIAIAETSASNGKQSRDGKTAWTSSVQIQFSDASLLAPRSVKPHLLLWYNCARDWTDNGRKLCRACGNSGGCEGKKTNIRKESDREKVVRFNETGGSGDSSNRTNIDLFPLEWGARSYRFSIWPPQKWWSPLLAAQKTCTRNRRTARNRVQSCHQIRFSSVVEVLFSTYLDAYLEEQHATTYHRLPCRPMFFLSDISRVRRVRFERAISRRIICVNASLIAEKRIVDCKGLRWTK